MTTFFRGILLSALLPASAAIMLSGCSENEKANDEPELEKAPPSEAKPGEKEAETKPVAPVDAPEAWTEELLHKAILAKNPDYKGTGQFQINEDGQPVAVGLGQSGVSNIEMLAGMPLMALDLQRTPVASIAPLKGMPLVELYIEGTEITDLSPLAGNTTMRKLYLSQTRVANIAALKGMPLEELNMVDCAAKDVSALNGMPLRMLWCTGMPVKDLSPLENSPLVSLTLHKTQVNDLTPLAKSPTLQRLHIGDTPVNDLTPLAKLPLTRLVFTPKNIKKGIDEIRQIATMQQLAVDFENDMSTLMPPTAFWPKYDAGEFK